MEQKKKHLWMLAVCLISLCLALSPGNILSQTDTVGTQQNTTSTSEKDNSSAPKSAASVFLDDTIRIFYASQGPFLAGDRAAHLSSKLENVVDVEAFDSSLLIVQRFEQRLDVVYNGVVLTSVTNRDAQMQNTSRQALADQVRSSIIRTIQSNKAIGWLATLKRIGLLFFVVLIFFFGIRLLNRGLNWANNLLLKFIDRYIRGVRLQNTELLSHAGLVKIITLLLNLLKKLFLIILIYISLPIVFSIFPATEGIARTLISYTLSPLKSFGLALIGFLPELFTIIIVILLTRYFNRFIRFISLEVERGKLVIPGFYPEWAPPTFNLLRILSYIFAFIIIFPYLPGSHSPAFQGVSVFLGLLISLGSSSAIGNLIAGLVIIYMRAFKLGDRVKIGESVGDVIEKTMLVTRLRTIKNEEITIPNSSILNGSTINYSNSSKEIGLILNSTVTIGYDVPWRQVSELLISAALKTDKIKDNPQPFVLQTELSDFYVSYQINAYTLNPELTAKIYSNLHENIQDAFNAAGVEILSPHYRAQRDGESSTIPTQADDK